MASSSSSFDIVSDFDRQEMVNTVDQVRREIAGRYDLKDTKTQVDLGETVISIETASEMTLEAIDAVLRQKAAKRGIDQKVFEFGTPEAASGNRVRQEIVLKKGIDKDLGKKIVKLVRDDFKKVQASIQGDAVRVSSKSKDDLQAVIQRLKSEDWPVALQFENYR